jgi:hypothetical protein
METGDRTFEGDWEPIDLLVGGKHHLRLTKIVKSHKSDKKWDAHFLIMGANGVSHEKVVSFGAKGYQDFTQHKDEDRKRHYLERHGRGHESWSSPATAGALARWVLWNKPGFRESVRDYKRRFHLG